MVSASACGGDDSASTTVGTTAATVAQTAAATTTTEAVKLEVQYVTEGAKVQVANASRVNGAAKRMSDQLKDKGYTVGTPVSSGSTLQRIPATKVFYVSGDENAFAVANGLKDAFGGSSEIEVAEMPTPAPTETGDLDSGVTVLVAIGNDTADKTLEELQGLTKTETASSDEETTTTTVTTEAKAETAG